MTIATARQADLWSNRPRPPHYGGNHIPASYLARMTIRGTVEPDDRIPATLARFIESVTGE